MVTGLVPTDAGLRCLIEMSRRQCAGLHNITDSHQNRRQGAGLRCRRSNIIHATLELRRCVAALSQPLLQQQHFRRMQATLECRRRLVALPQAASQQQHFRRMQAMLENWRRRAALSQAPRPLAAGYRKRPFLLDHQQQYADAWTCVAASLQNLTKHLKQHQPAVQNVQMQPEGRQTPHKQIGPWAAPSH